MEPQLIIEPKEEIRFIGPYSRLSANSLQLTNPNPVPVAFKVLTTAPTRFQVSPVCGIVKAHGQQTIDVQMPPLFDASGQPVGETFKFKKQKFQVQWLALHGDVDDNADVKAIMSTADKVQSTKIRCVFDETTDANGSMANQASLPSVEQLRASASGSSSKTSGSANSQFGPTLYATAMPALTPAANSADESSDDLLEMVQPLLLIPMLTILALIILLNMVL